MRYLKFALCAVLLCCSLLLAAPAQAAGFSLFVGSPNRSLLLQRNRLRSNRTLLIQRNRFVNNNNLQLQLIQQQRLQQQLLQQQLLRQQLGLGLGLGGNCH